MKAFLKDPLAWIEIAATAIAGLASFSFGNPALGAAAVYGGSLLIFHRYALAKSMDEMIEPIGNGISAIGDYVDLESAAMDSRELRQAVDTYFRIPDAVLGWHKRRAVTELQRSLQLMLVQGRSPTMLTAEYYSWLLPQIEKTKPGAHIWAVSRMMDCEWDSSPEEIGFLQLNIDAALRGVKVTRLFITSPEVWQEACKTGPVADQINTAGIEVYFGDESAIRRRDAKILDVIGDGLIAFDEQAMLIDEHSTDGTARGYVSVGPSEIQRQLECFNSLKNMCERIIVPKSDEA